MDSNNSDAAAAAAGSSSSNAGDRSWVTLDELLKEQEEMKAASDAVLGGSDDKNCTYALGYIGRQALYACMTCLPESRIEEDKRAGVCLACSYHCHEGHDLIELYTKRNFRCDCGGKRMPDMRCKLDPLKIEANQLNEYNQNFSGSYCTCQRPYPDPENDVEDEMIQCVVCEDWYHARHLDGDAAAPCTNKDFAEMICGGCVERLGFLRNYVGKAEDPNRTQLNDTVQVDVTGLDESNVAETSTVSNDESKTEEDESTTRPAQENDAKRAKLDICTKPPYDEADETAYKKGATFWNDGWRTFLCRCTDCAATYKDRKVEFLLDEKDTVQWYEEHGRIKLQQDERNADDEAMKAFNKMGRVQQVEFLTGMNHMHSRLREFLDTFVASQQVVTEKDVHDFFAKLREERSEAGGTPSHFCR